MKYSLKESGKDKKVRIEDDGYGLYLFIMRNGFQWTGNAVDDELLSMIADAIDEYFKVTAKDPMDTPDDGNTGDSIDWANGNMQKVTMTDDCTF